MKTRNDFVSNSSSSSFILQFSDNGACIDKQFMKMLHYINYFNLHGCCKSKAHFEELKIRAENAFGPGCISDQYYDDNYIYITCSKQNLSKDSDCTEQITVIKDILSLKDSRFSCSCGSDGEYDLSRAAQFATLFEVKYKNITVEADDHFYYCTIRGTDLDF